MRLIYWGGVLYVLCICASIALTIEYYGGDILPDVQFIRRDVTWVPDAYSPTRLKVCGNIVEVRTSRTAFNPPAIEKLDNDSYIDLCTGEVKAYNHECLHFGDNKQSALRATRNFRDLINSTCTDSRNAVFITLTYRQRDNPSEVCRPMTDLKRLYRDFDVFRKRFERYNESLFREKPAYFMAVEPHGPRPDGSHGGWHAHLILYWFDGPRPWLDYSRIYNMWGQGLVNIQDCRTQEKYTGNPSRDIDNIGAYLSAYVTDLYPDSGDVSDKRRVKHERLQYYEKGMKPFRHSRNIKKPTIYKCFYNEIKNYVSIDKSMLTYTSSFDLILSEAEKEYSNTITTEYYNLIRG